MPSESPIDKPNAQLAIPGLAEVVPGINGLPCIQITTPAATAEVYLHGAQLTSWQPTGHEEVLFLSEQSLFQDGKAIRGGIPICFPWFRDLPRAKADDPKAPAHGFVRTKAWNLESLAQIGDQVVVTLATQSDRATRALWPHDFRIEHRITVGPQLTLELTVINTGTAPFQFEEALHSYHLVGDAANLRISGLDTIAYLDNRDQNRKKIQLGDLLLTQPTDNAYQHTEGPVSILDPVLRRRIHIDKQNSESTVVWNPWQQSADALADLGNHEWRSFACVEAANILAAAIHLTPGDRHTLSATIRLDQA